MVFETVGGKFICVKSQLEYDDSKSKFSSGCSTHYVVADDIAGIIEYFGHSEDARLLYDLLSLTDLITSS